MTEETIPVQKIKDLIEQKEKSIIELKNKKENSSLGRLLDAFKIGKLKEEIRLYNELLPKPNIEVNIQFSSAVDDKTKKEIESWFSKFPIITK